MNITYTNTTVEKAVQDIAGREILPLFKALRTGKTLSETRLAARIKQEVNQTRTMLYRLHHANLVTCTRKKDPKNGWYVYYWGLRPKPLRDLVEKHQNRNEPIQMDSRISGFRCASGCLDVSLEEAIELEFRCTECGELMGTDRSGRPVITLAQPIRHLSKARK